MLHRAPLADTMVRRRDVLADVGALTPGRAAGRIGAGHGAARVAGWARTMGVMKVRRVCACVLAPHMRACVQMSVHVIERARALPLTWCALTPGRAAGRIGAGHGAARVAGWARTMGVMRTLRPRVRRRRRMPGACSTRTTAPRTWASRSRRGDGEHAL